MWTGQNHASARKPATGLTLTELLIAIIIAAFVIIAVGNLEIMRGKVQRTQQSMDLVQNEAQRSLYHMGKHFYAAYYFRFNGNDPTRIYLQSIKPGALGVPTDPNKLSLTSSYRYDGYVFDNTKSQLMFQENVLPTKKLPGFKESVLATNVESLTITQVARNVYQVTLVALDLRANRRYTLGPVELASREMVIDPPTGWVPPAP